MDRGGGDAGSVAAQGAAGYNPRPRGAFWEAASWISKGAAGGGHGRGGAEEYALTGRHPGQRQAETVKLIIQVPCFNEEQTLGQVLADLPKTIPGLDVVETLVINDGSTDATSQLARSMGVHHIVELPHNRGLAVAWLAGIDACLREGADIIVNTDGDNQYAGDDIAKLVAPIVNGEAEMVIGARPIEEIRHFSWLKKRLQRLGSWAVTVFTGIQVPDAASGFRAYTREAALLLSAVRPQYTHTIDTLIRAAQKNLKIRSVPVRVNEKARDSRLIASTRQYVWRQSLILLRVFTMTQPLKVFGLAALAFLMLGLAGCVRFLVYYVANGGSGHVQSVVISAGLIVVGFVVGMIGLAADMISANRELIEDSLYRLRKAELERWNANRAAAARDTGSKREAGDAPQALRRGGTVV